jgi:predicted signal transduction protein with EAL and GGDEF domain
VPAQLWNFDQPDAARRINQSSGPEPAALHGATSRPLPSGSVAPANERQPVLDRIGDAIRNCVATATTSAVVLVDMHDFAGINAAWGVATGNQALAAVAERIEDFAARMMTSGGTGMSAAGRLDADHFVILVSNVASYERIRSLTAELIRTLARPLSLGGQTVAMTSRAVIVPIPSYGRSVTAVLGRGFRLLNTTARSRADGVAVCDANELQPAAASQLERDLAAALTTDQLFIALQPKVEVATGAVRGAEALVRWRHPERGMLPPPTFIGAAEKSGLIFDLGLRILRDACRAGRQLADRRSPLPLAVNVSPLQLEHPEFLSRFLEIIDQESIAPELLSIEVTETAAMMGGERITRSLQSLRRCGIGIAIDDFGTGFSNLASLSTLPADTLKIDRSLVVGGEDGGKGGALLEIAVQLGRTFGLSTVAEGVETASQFRHVTELGCDLVQGFLTGRPAEVDDFAERYLGI